MTETNEGAKVDKMYFFSYNQGPIRQVQGWPNYWITEDGEIASVNKGKWRWKKPVKNKNGYLYVTFWDRKNDRIETHLIHRLVAKHFLNHADESLDVAHLDGNKTNNTYKNLKWCTRKENESHKVIHGTKAKGVTNGQAKLCDRSIEAIKKLVKEEKWTQKKVATLFRVSQQNISAILQGKSWHHN